MVSSYTDDATFYKFKDSTLGSQGVYATHPAFVFTNSLSLIKNNI